MDITERIIKETSDMIGIHLQRHQNDLDDAYRRAEGDALSVSIGVKYQPDKDGLKIATNFSFTLEKIKEQNEIIIDENQRGLFEK